MDSFANEKKLKSNMKKILRLQLALESYEDDNKSNNLLLKEVNLELKRLRSEREALNIVEQIELSEAIVEKYNKVLDIIGRNNFVFYEDGDINYIWKGN